MSVFNTPRFTQVFKKKKTEIEVPAIQQPSKNK